MRRPAPRHRPTLMTRHNLRDDRGFLVRESQPREPTHPWRCQDGRWFRYEPHLIRDGHLADDGQPFDDGSLHGPTYIALGPAVESSGCRTALSFKLLDRLEAKPAVPTEAYRR